MSEEIYLSVRCIVIVPVPTMFPIVIRNCSEGVVFFSFFIVLLNLVTEGVENVQNVKFEIEN
jgi:hypothetical protein